MKALAGFIKLSTTFFVCMTIVAIVESFYDKDFYATTFLDNIEEVDLGISSKKEERVVASRLERVSLPKIQKVPKSLKSVIEDGKWVITRILDSKGNEVFRDSNNNEIIIVEFELIGESIVRVDKDNDQVFNVSLFTDQGTIALFKEFDLGYEIIEAKKYNNEASISEEEGDKNKRTSNSKVIKYNIEEDLFLVSALDPKSNKGVLKGDLINGNAILKNGDIILENIQLYIGQKSQTETFSTEATIEGHGTFNDGIGTQGIVTKVQDDEIKVRFSVGPLAGIMLSFASYDKKHKASNSVDSSINSESLSNEKEEREDFQRPINGTYQKPQQYVPSFLSEGETINEEADNIQGEDVNDTTEDYQANYDGQYDDEYSDSDQNIEENSEYVEVVNPAGTRKENQSIIETDQGSDDIVSNTSKDIELVGFSF